MASLGAVADNVYRRFGKRGSILVLFITSLIIHTIFAIQMEPLAVDPNEFVVASYSSLFCGGNWSGVVSKIGYYYGYIMSVLYTPLMYFIKDPFVLYRAMLVLNGILVSLVPVIVYSLSAKVGIEKAWQRMIIALSCGLYSAYIASTKFIWNETPCVVLPWVILYLMFKISEAKTKPRKHFLSILAGFLFAVSFAAHERLLSAVIAAFLVAVLARVVFKKTYLCFSTFIPSFVGFIVLERLITAAVKQSLWLSANVTLNNTLEMGLSTFSGRFGSGGLMQLVETLFGHLYYFVTSTWGLGGIALYLFILIVTNVVALKRKKALSGYKSEYAVLCLYAFFTIAGAMATSIAYKLGEEGFYSYQDTAIFGRYMDSVIPFSIMLVLVFIFLYGFDFTRLLGGVIVIGAIDLGFFVFTAPIITAAEKARISPILGLYPIRIGQSIDSVLDSNSLLLTASSVFCVVAVLIVVVCCAKKYLVHILSFLVLGLMMYSLVLTANVYLPYCTAETRANNAAVYEIREHLYNQADAPQITVYKTTRRTAALVQFLCQQSDVLYTKNRADIIENCFILTPKGEQLILPNTELIIDEDIGDDGSVIRINTDGEADKIPLQQLASTDDFTLYAYGEKAIAYARSQR